MTEPVGPFRVVGVSGLDDSAIEVGGAGHVRWEGYWAGPFWTFAEARRSLELCGTGDPSIVLGVYDEGARSLYLPDGRYFELGARDEPDEPVHSFQIEHGDNPTCFVCRQPIDPGDEVELQRIEGAVVWRHKRCTGRPE